MPILRRRRAAAVLALAPIAAAAALRPAPAAHAAGEEGYGTKMVGHYALELASGQDAGLDVRAAFASVTPRPGGRLHVRLALVAAGWGGDRTATVRATPCAGLDFEDEMVCRGGRAQRLTVPADAPAAATTELDIAAPTGASQAIRVAVDAGEETAVSFTLPATTWRGALAGRPVGVRTPAGPGDVPVALEVGLRVDAFADDTAWLSTLAVADNRSGERRRLEAATRLCAAGPSCHGASETVTVKPHAHGTLAPEQGGSVRRPRGAAAVLTFRVVARPSNAVVATASLPWPAAVAHRKR